MKLSQTNCQRPGARSLVLAMLASLAVGSVTLTWSQQTTLSTPAEPRADGQVIIPETSHFIRSVEISPKLPRYRFVLKPDIATNHPYPSPTQHIGSIDVFKGHSKAVWQRIDVEGVDPSWLTNSFRPVDINGDGYQDLAVVYERGGKWTSDSYFLFDPGSGRFLTNALTTDLRKLTHNGLTLHPGKKEIRVSKFIGVCLNSFEVYRIENGRLALLESEIHFPREPGRCLVEKRKRVEGEIVLVESKERKHELPPGLQNP